MAKTHSRHTRLKRQAAGPTGRTEKRQPGGTRLDARKPGRPPTSTEVERSGNLRAALQRLAKERSAKKQLLVPQTDLDRAAQLAAQMDINVTIQNLSKTRRRIVKP